MELAGGASFDTAVAPHLGGLRLHCYRMLGRLTDAEDALQDTLLSAWRGLGSFDGRSSLKTWLYRIATNRCLNLRRDASRRPQAPQPPFTVPEPTRRAAVGWVQPCPTPWLEAAGTDGPAERSRLRESVELAFLVAGQLLPPRQLAAMLLVDVLGFTAAETAGMLDSTPTAVKALLQRARTALASLERHDPAPGATDRVARDFAEAFAGDDIAGMLALLTDDAWLAMPPAPHEYQGAAAIAGFLRVSTSWRQAGGLRWSLTPTEASGQPAFTYELLGPDGPAAAGLVVLTLRGDRVSRVTRLLDDDLARRWVSSERPRATSPV